MQRFVPRDGTAKKLLCNFAVLYVQSCVYRVRHGPCTRPLAHDEYVSLEPTMSVQDASLLLGLPADLPLSHQVRRGLPFAVVERLAARLGISRTHLSRMLLIPARTLSARKRSGVLSMEESDRLVRVARLLAEAERVLASPEAAHSWLMAGDDRFDGRTPVEQAVTDPGMQEAMDVLWAIESWGVS